MDSGKILTKYVTSLMLFGSNGIVTSYILLSSGQTVFFRTLIGSIFLIFAILITKTKINALKNKKDLFYTAISGVALGGAWILLCEAYTKIGVSLSTVLYYCGPVIVIAVSPLIFGEKITVSKLLGIVAVLFGMFMLNKSELLSGGLSVGVLYGIMAAVLYSVMVIFSKKAPSIKGVENSAIQLLSSFAVSAVFLAVKGDISFNIGHESIVPIIILGVVNTGLGCFLYFSSIQGLKAQTVSIFGYIEPLSALVYSAFILGERMSFSQSLGAVFIIGGVAAGEFISDDTLRAAKRFMIRLKVFSKGRAAH